MKAMRLSRATGLLVIATTLACSRKPASIVVTPRKVVLYGIERAQRLTAQVLDAKGQPVEGPAPTWTSSKSEVAEVDAAGRVLSKGEGKAQITATLGAISAQVAVEVIDAATIEVVPPQARIVGPPGTTFLLNAVVKGSKDQPVAVKPTWTSSDEKVVKVSPDGLITSVGNGTASVTARVGELEGGAEVSVLAQEIDRLELRPATALVRVGDSQKFQVVAYAADGTRLENAVANFHTSNPGVATVDGSGVAVGVTAGTATIRVEIAGRQAESILIVN